MASADRVSIIVAWLKRELAGKPLPEVGIVCGSGLGHLAEVVSDKKSFKYQDIPLFPQSTVDGHKSELVYGKLSGKPVLLMRGRFHFYEGYSPLDVAIPIRAMAALGIKVLVVTNAAGGVDPKFSVGDIMIIDDHIFFPGMAGFNPLVGPNDSRFGPRFPPLSEQFDKNLQEIVRKAGERAGFKAKLRTGCYCNVSGPNYETRHEIEMMRSMRGSAVGMSTVQEVIVAVHAGMKVLGLSVITNNCQGPDDKIVPPNHAEVLEAAKEAEPMMQRLVQDFVAQLQPASLSEPPAAKHFRDHALSAAELAAAERAARRGQSCDGITVPSGALPLLALLVAAGFALGRLSK